MEVKPLRDRVLIKPIKENPVTEETIMAVVIAVGDEAKVKAGDTVIYEQPGKITIKVDNEDCLIVRMSDIVAVIT